MTSLLVFGALAGIATPGTAEYVQSGILLALIVGVIRVFLGWIRAGVLAYLMSQPVLMGFTSAAAILIVASQVELIFGMPPGDGSLPGRAIRALMQPGQWNPVTLGISAGTAAVIVGGKRLHRLVPGVLIAVVAGLLLNRWLHLPVESLGEIPARLPSLQREIPLHAFRQLIVPGGVIALVGFAEPAAIGAPWPLRIASSGIQIASSSVRVWQISRPACAVRFLSEVRSPAARSLDWPALKRVLRVCFPE